MKKFFVLLGLLLFFVTPVFSATWVQITEKSYIDKDSISTFVDDYNIEHKGQIIYWRKDLNDGSEYFKNIEKQYKKKIWYVMCQGIVNTNNKTLACKTVIFYDLKGQSIETSTMPDVLLEYIRIVPNSFGELLYSVVSDNTLLDKIYEAQLEKGN